LVGHFTLRVVFQSAELPEGDSARLVLLFLLVVDKAFREYNAGRAVLDAYARSANQTSLYHEGVGRFETCIHSVVRALRLADRIARGVGTPEVNRDTRKQLNRALESFRHMRNEIEHMDNHIADGQLAEGEAHALMVLKDGRTLEIAKYRLTFTELADALTQLHGVAMELIEGLVPSPPAHREQLTDS
jgi:hypothetical protein